MEGLLLNNEVQYIKINSIRPNPYQPRKIFNELSLEELKKSIQQYGVLQPISVRKLSSDKYELIAGERRLRASKLAGIDVIPAVIIETGDENSAIIALIENLQREDLDFIEEAEGYNNLIEEYHFTQEELAKKLGKSQSTIANKLRILKLPGNIIDIIKCNNLTERHARALLRLHDEKQQLKVLNEVITKNMNVKETEDLIQKILENYKKVKVKIKKRKVIKALKDIRIYINTIKQAVSLMRGSGVAATLEQTEDDMYIEYKIKIKK